MNLRLGLGIVSLLALGACVSLPPEHTDTSHDALRPLNKQEALAELTQVGNAIRAGYGPLEYKKQKFGFDLDQELARAKAAIEVAETEADRVRPVYELLAKLQDGHVGLRYPVRATEASQHQLKFVVTPVADSFLVAFAWQEAAPLVQPGDKVLSIDGKTPAELEEIIGTFSKIGTPESSRHFAGLNMTIRPYYAPKSMLPQGPNAHVELERADGTRYAVDLPWQTTKGGFTGLFAQAGGGATASATPPSSPASVLGATLPEAYSGALGYMVEAESGHAPEANMYAWGVTMPFFLTKAVREKLGVIEVYPKPETLASFGVNLPPENPATPDRERAIQIRGFKYRFGGKTILLVRIPAFTVPKNNYDENVAWLGALLKDNAAVKSTLPGIPTPELPLSLTPDEVADAVVVDVTHNPGGLVPYVAGMASLFAPANGMPNFVQATRADRQHLGDMQGGVQRAGFLQDAPTQQVYTNRMRLVEDAYDTGKHLAPFLPLSGAFKGPTLQQTPLEWAGSEVLPANPLVTWSKPTLVLHDELSGSGGDAFPLLMQNGGVAKTFGARTAAMGGSVQPLLTLPYSGGVLNLTRGLFGANNSATGMQLVENEGVKPNFPYAHTVADHRAGFVDYTTAFSKIISTLTR